MFSAISIDPGFAYGGTSEPPRYDRAHPFGYQGGTFTGPEVASALADQRPLTLDLSIPGACLNRCGYCGYYAVNDAGKLTKDEVIDVIAQFAGLGGRSIKILGEGEPLLRPDICDILETISNHGVIPVLFTCGDVLGDDQLSGRLHGAAGRELCRQLFVLGCTVVLKFEAWEQDRIVGRKGYSELRNRALATLLDLGFNLTFPTRLGLGTVLLRQNYNGVPAIYRFALERNIYPLVCPLMPIGRSKTREWRDRIAPSRAATLELSRHLVDIRGEFGVADSPASDFPGGLPCDVARCGMYVDDIGQAFLCESDSLVGSCRTEPLSALWRRANALKWHCYGQTRRSGKCGPKRRCGIV